MYIDRIMNEAYDKERVEEAQMAEAYDHVFESKTILHERVEAITELSYRKVG